MLNAILNGVKVKKKLAKSIVVVLVFLSYFMEIWHHIHRLVDQSTICLNTLNMKDEIIRNVFSTQSNLHDVTFLLFTKNLHPRC